MNDIIFGLSVYILKRTNKKRSHYYRYRKLLNKKCGDIDGVAFLKTPQEEHLARTLSEYGPLDPNDLDSSEERVLLKKWKRIFPNDRNFFAMALAQKEIWGKFSNRSVSSFLKSPEGKAWSQARTKLSRRALFELDRPFRKSNLRAKQTEEKIRRFLRRYPLAGFKDLRELGIPNAQKIYERFPHRELHRQTFLSKLKRELGLVK